MEITGKLIKVLEETRGESQRGPWVRGGFVIETDSEYPRQVAFTTFGEDRVAMIKSIAPGTNVVVNFSLESREFNDRWYTDARASRVQTYVPGQMPGAPMMQQPIASVPPQGTNTMNPTSTVPNGTQMPSGEDENLPF